MEFQGEQFLYYIKTTVDMNSLYQNIQLQFDVNAKRLRLMLSFLL